MSVDTKLDAAWRLWRMRDLFECAQCDGEVCAEDCRCDHHEDIGALSEAIRALGYSPSGGQMYRSDSAGRRLAWQAT